MTCIVTCEAVCSVLLLGRSTFDYFNYISDVLIGKDISLTISQHFSLLFQFINFAKKNQQQFVIAAPEQLFPSFHVLLENLEISQLKSLCEKFIKTVVIHFPKHALKFMSLL